MTEIAADVDAIGSTGCLPCPTMRVVALYRAMRHAAIGGGKRLRPLLLIATADLFGGLAATVRDAPRPRWKQMHVYSLDPRRPAGDG